MGDIVEELTMRYTDEKVIERFNKYSSPFSTKAPFESNYVKKCGSDDVIQYRSISEYLGNVVDDICSCLGKYSKAEGAFERDIGLEIRVRQLLKNIADIFERLGTRPDVPKLLAVEDSEYENMHPKTTNGCYLQRTKEVHIRKSFAKNARTIVGVHESVHHTLTELDISTHYRDWPMMEFRGDNPCEASRLAVFEGFAEYLTEKALMPNIKSKADVEMKRYPHAIPYFIGAVLYGRIEKAGGTELLAETYKNCRTAQDLLHTLVIATKKGDASPTFEHHQNTIRTLKEDIRKKLESVGLKYNENEIDRILFWD